MPLMGVDTRPDLPDHLGARRRRWPASPPACWCCSTTSIPRRAVVRADHLPDLRARRPRQHGRRLRRRLHLRRVHLGGRPLLDLEWGYVFAFVFFIVMMFFRPAGPAGAPLMSARRCPGIAGAALVALPFVYHAPYPLHILVIILIWAFVYTCWSLMGRFGLVSLGHGGFMGDRRLRDGAAVEPLRTSRPGSASRWRCSRGGVRGGADRLSLLPLPHHRPLLRAGDAGADRASCCR